MSERSDRSTKRQRVLKIMADRGIEAVLLRSAPALNWYLDGARTHVSLAAAPVLSVRVTRAADEVWLTDNEAARLSAEELPADIELHERPWYATAPGVDAVGEAELAQELWAARWPLLPGETDRFRALGTDAAAVGKGAGGTDRPPRPGGAVCPSARTDR